MRTRNVDYRYVAEGVIIEHSGCSSVIVTKFGDSLTTGLAITRTEEVYIIDDDCIYNVNGLSVDTFVPPDELQMDYSEE